MRKWTHEMALNTALTWTSSHEVIKNTNQCKMTRKATGTPFIRSIK